MDWFLKRTIWCGGLISSTALIACISPSLAIPILSSTLLDETQSPSTNEVAQLPDPLDPQLDPNEERFPQPVPTPLPLPADEAPSVTPSPSPDEPIQSPQPISIKTIEVVADRTIFGPEIDQIIQPLRKERSVTSEALSSAIQAIQDLYFQAGYITSKVVLDEATLNTGDIKIRVIEGTIQEIRVEGTRRLNPDYVRSRVRLGAKRPLNANQLESQLRLLKADPLFDSVEASLQAGTGPGQSILTVRVTEANRLGLTFGFDNYTPPSIAPERASIAARYRNLTGLGDELAAAYAVGTNLGDFNRAALNIYSLSYRVPLNPMEGTLQFSADIINNKITDPEFADSGIEGESEFFELSYRQPMIRTLREELALSVGFGIQGGQTFIFNNRGFPFGIGPDSDGVSRTRVLKFGQDYTRRDTGGAWAAQSLFSVGVDVFGATTNPRPIPDGRFFSWLGQLLRVQRLGDDNLLLVQGNVQLTPNSLLPFQQFVIGGGQSLRGYRQNARSGDSGFRLSVEGRFPILRDRPGAADLQLAPFVDIGQVWNQSDNPNSLPGPTFLASVGLGLLWQPVRDFNIRLDYGIPLVDLETQGTGSLQDDGFHFSVTYNL